MLHLLRFVFLFVCCLFVVTIVSACRTTIVVNNQTEFDGLQEKLTSSIKAGKKDVYVKLLPGTYVAKEKHIMLKNITAMDIKIQIKGKGAILIPSGSEYHDGDMYQGTFSVDNSWMSGTIDVETWSYIQYADGQVEILDATEKACRIKSKNLFPTNMDYSNAYIMIPHWFRSSVYKIDKIDQQYIYFVADDLKESSYGGYNVNDDFNYGKKNIRYKLCNVETRDDYLRVIDGRVHLPKNINTVWEGTTHQFLTIQDSKLASVEIAGIQIHGNAFAESNPAIYIKNSECKEIRIHHCGFYGMRGNVISVTASPNVIIDNNKFEGCYYYGIKSNNESTNTIVEKNHFASMGKRMSNTPCVRCQGTNFVVSDNTFVNFGYCGISTGIWYKSDKKQPCFGLIEKNNLCFDHDYLSHIDNYGIMDGGAIYIATKNDGSKVRYNYIHGFSGMKSNRGVFCDDGAYNIEIYGNVITSIVNSRCIDSRRMAKVESSKTPESDVDRANVNIVIRDNIVDGGIRFEGNEEPNNGCVMGTNYFLRMENAELPKNIIDNVSVEGENTTLNYTGEKRGRVGLASESIRQLKKTSVWKEVNRNLVRKDY